MKKTLTCLCHVCKTYGKLQLCQYCGCETENMIELLRPVKEIQEVVKFLEELEQGADLPFPTEVKQFQEYCKGELDNYETILKQVLPRE